MSNVNPNSGGQKNGGQPLAPSDNYGNSDDDEDGQNDDIESPHTEDMQMTSSGVGRVRKKNFATFMVLTTFRLSSISFIINIIITKKVFCCRTFKYKGILG